MDKDRLLRNGEQMREKEAYLWKGGQQPHQVIVAKSKQRAERAREKQVAEKLSKMGLSNAATHSRFA